MTTTPDILDILERELPDRSAMSDSRCGVRYSELAPTVFALARALQSRGVRPGDRVAVAMPNSVQAVELFLACARLGAIWVGINPAAPLAERERQLALVIPRIVIADSTAGDWRVGTVVDPADLVIQHLTEPPKLEPGWPGPDLPCAIAFSSGTTGTPKAIVHSRAAISLAAASLAVATLEPGDRLGVCLPLSILNVMIVGPLAGLFAGATTITLNKLDAPSVAAECSRHQLTTLRALVPTTLYDLTYRTDIPADALSSMRVAGVGAAGLPKGLREAFEAKFGVRVVGSYGLSEAPAAVCYEDPREPHREGSSGTVLQHVSMSVRDSAGRALPPGVRGELWIGPASDGAWKDLYRPSLGTWDRESLSPRQFDGRWLATGDIGLVDAHGHVYVVGRNGDVIVRGGVNVTVAELEAVLAEIDGVRDVAVLGRPDPRLGEKIIAYVELEPGRVTDSMMLRSKARDLLSHGKMPDDFVVVDQLPRNVMGKVIRTQLAGGFAK